MSVLEEGTVDGDARRLRQLFLNLITNAIKYTPRGGRVELSLSHRLANEIAFTVRDSGIGMSAADLSHVFERFWRADRARASVAASAWVWRSASGSRRLMADASPYSRGWVVARCSPSRCRCSPRRPSHRPRSRLSTTPRCARPAMCVTRALSRLRRRSRRRERAVSAAALSFVISGTNSVFTKS
jgi:hypothetical protein